MEHRWYTQHNRPVIRNFGLIIGKNKIPLEKSIVSMLRQFGFKREEAEQSLNANKHNQVTTIYYLLHKYHEKRGQLPSHFNIMKRSSTGDSAERQAEGFEGRPPEEGTLPGSTTAGPFPGGLTAASMDFEGIKEAEDRGNGDERSLRREEGLGAGLESTPGKHKNGLLSLEEGRATPPDKFGGALRESIRRSDSGDRGRDERPDSPTDFSGRKPKKMDSRKELELSCSPVKGSRRKRAKALPDSVDGSPREAHRIPFEGFAGGFSRGSEGQGHYGNEFEAESKAMMERKRAEKIEEQGSRSPDKKRRRAV